MYDLPILCVDDDPQMRILIGAALKKNGFHWVGAADGSSALSTIQALNGCLSLIVTDFIMPGMDGGTLALNVKNRFPGIPIILISSDRKATECRCVDAFLGKPFLPSVLLGTIRELLERSPKSCD